ncbi:uncharacterized protein LOC126672348 [Mercurialis annua]|uniref:uncharacterized protein LOC126672348 n=1 Tax=Mercurialis annua TaxID=3986 RepID=UPI00215F6AF0|nr:uncharacterized protein LOC126672348 [Mercurialis annua]XP_050222254.1 uncharacterized protein LOC126672348 [Mercurialis annua]
MQQRKSGRPSGTDGSDFSYRMVVDSRYTEVAKGKSRLGTLLKTQIVVQLMGLICMVQLIANGKAMNKFAVSSSAAGSYSLLIGEFGRRRSKVGLLRLYIYISSIALLLSIYCSITSNSTLEAIWNMRDWQKKKFELAESLVLLFGSLVQIITISTVLSLIGNMSPPKKAS